MTPPNSLAEILKANQHTFHSVVRFDATKEKLIPFDFSEKNSDLEKVGLEDTQKFTEYINQQLKNANAKFGIGGYNEQRTVYRASKIFDANKSGEEPRRLHLGVDIWSKPHSPVIAPLDGIVHSFAFNNQMGDYGGTIILSHSLGGFSFHTLYGHLSFNSLRNMEEGRHIEKGELFAEFGIPSENGSWPPHLHFQIIIDTRDWKGDYPGVCKYSEREEWLSNSPDPDMILQFNQYI